MTIELTYELADALLQRAVDERGEDFIYPEEWKTERGQCQYAVNGEPACIVGLALSYAGVDVESLPNDPVDELVGDDFIVDDQRTWDLLAHAQLSQDDGWSWGKSLAHARERVALR